MEGTCRKPWDFGSNIIYTPSSLYNNNGEREYLLSYFVFFVRVVRDQYDFFKKGIAFKSLKCVSQLFNSGNTYS